MGRFVKREVIVFPFPFSNLATTKKRPVLVVASLQGDDLILCQITSRERRKDRYSIMLGEDDFEDGGLRKQSYIRPNRLFTGDSSIAHYSVRKISKKKMKEVTNKINEIIK